MQKVLRRTALSQRQGKRRAKLQSETEERAARSEFRRNAKQINSERRDAILAERGRRRAHWELGPLSPWRNNFDQLMSQTGFGSWSVSQVNYPNKPPRDRTRDLMIREGDRVVVIEGHESIKGRVGKVTDVAHEAEMVVVEGINRADINTQLTEAEKERGSARFQTTEVPIPYRSLRLVYPLPDPSTGLPRDVILNKLTARRRRFDIYENKEVFERWLEPQHIRIPWPDKTDPLYVDEEGDTLRVQTEEQSFLPTLLRPPMPMGIIDELRNKFGRYRDRHDEEYIAKKEAEDAAEEVEKQRRAAVIPRGARNIARRRGFGGGKDQEEVLSDDLAAQIGQHMASRTVASRETPKIS